MPAVFILHVTSRYGYTEENSTVHFNSYATAIEYIQTIYGGAKPCADMLQWQSDQFTFTIETSIINS